MFGFGTKKTLTLESFISQRGKWDDFTLVANIDLGTVKAAMNLTELYAASTVLAFMLDHLKSERSRAIEYAVLSHVLRKDGSEAEKKDADLSYKSSERWFVDNEPRSYQLCLDAQDLLRSHLRYEKRVERTHVNPGPFVTKIATADKVAPATTQDLQMISLMMAFLAQVDPMPAQQTLNLASSLFVLNRAGSLRERDLAEATIQMSIRWSIEGMQADSDGMMNSINTKYVQLVSYLQSRAS